MPEVQRLMYTSSRHRSLHTKFLCDLYVTYTKTGLATKESRIHIKFCFQLGYLHTKTYEIIKEAYTENNVSHKSIYVASDIPGGRGDAGRCS